MYTYYNILYNNLYNLFFKGYKLQIITKMYTYPPDLCIHLVRLRTIIINIRYTVRRGLVK